MENMGWGWVGQECPRVSLCWFQGWVGLPRKGVWLQTVKQTNVILGVVFGFPRRGLGLCQGLGMMPAPKFETCWEEFCFSWGHPLGTECSIDKPKGTKISLQTASVYLGSSENTDGGWQPHLAQNSIPCLVARKSGASMLVVPTCTCAHTHTLTHARLPSTCRVHSPPP